MRTLYKITSVSIIVLLGCLASYGQDTGPGGVGASSNLNIWLDASQISLSDGDPVATWADLSGSGCDFTQSSPNQPTYNLSGSINSKPTVSFNGTSQFLEVSNKAALSTDVLSLFIVYQNQSALPQSGDLRYGMIIGTRSTTTPALEWALQIRRNNSTLVQVERYARKSPSEFKIAASANTNAESLASSMVSLMWRGSDDVYGQYDGGYTASTSGAVSTGFTHKDTQLGAARDPSSNVVRYFKGEIAEVVLYTTEVNSAQEKIVNAYLSSKYNITLIGDSIFDFKSTHPNDVAGIGRDDASNEHLTAQGTGVVSMTVGSLSNGDYMVWGDDGAGYGVTTSNLPLSYSGTKGNRINQEWIVTETGDLTDNGDITLTFDISANEFGYDQDYQLLIDQDGDDDWSNGDTIGGTYSAGILTFTVPAGTLKNGSKFTLSNKQTVVVSIASGQNWNDTTTWSCRCVPDNTYNKVFILNGHTVTVNDSESADTLTVNVGGTLVVDAGANFGVSGDLTSSGTFTVNSGSSIVLNGTSAQVVDFSNAISFDTLEVNNSSASGVVINSADDGTFTFSGTLLPTDGDIDFGANTVTFLSSASGTASVGPQLGGALQTITMTNVTSQRYIASGVAGFREVGFPFNNAYSLSDWDDEIFISGSGFPDGCAWTANGCYASAKYWNGTSLVGIQTIDSVLEAGLGVDIFLGDDLNTFAGAVLATTQPLNFTSSVNLTINSGWNFISNPFLAPIDFDNVTLGAGVQNYFYIYDASTDGWQWWDGASASVANLNGGLISAYQGFWVYNTGGASTLTIDQGSKSVASSDAFLKQSTLNNVDVMTLKMRKSGDSNYSSKLHLNLSSGSGIVAPKLPNIHEEVNLYANYEGHKYSRVDLPAYSGCSQIELGIDVIEEGDYNLSFDNVPDDMDIVLVDNQTGERVTVTDQNSYDYYVTEADSDRFELWLVEKGGDHADCDNSMEGTNDLTYGITSSGITISGFAVEEELSLSFEIIDLAGKIVYKESGVVNYGNDYYINKNLTSGVYLIRVSSADGNMVDAGKIVVN